MGWLLLVWFLGAVIAGGGLYAVGAGYGCRPWKRPILFAVCTTIGLGWPVLALFIIYDRMD